MGLSLLRAKMQPWHYRSLYRRSTGGVRQRIISGNGEDLALTRRSTANFLEMGDSMSTFTLIHVLISLIAILTWFVVFYGFLAGKRLPSWNELFKGMTIATSVTGFFFPFHGITPGIVLGVTSLMVLAVAILAWHQRWSKTYIVTATIAEFFNVLVLIVQSFQKVAPLHKLAPNGTEPITIAAKGIALVLFVGLAWVAIRRGRFVLG
jgi:hypothetical protein